MVRIVHEDDMIPLHVAGTRPLEIAAAQWLP